MKSQIMVRSGVRSGVRCIAIRNILILCFLHCSLFICNAQEIFTLEKCKELALKNNKKVENAQLSVEMAEQTKKEAFTKYFPNVSATGMGMVFSKPLYTTSVEVQTGYPAPNDVMAVDVDMFKNTITGAVVALQPIFAGGQIINGNRLAKKGVEVSQLQQQMANDEALLATESYYYQLVSLMEKTKTVAHADTMLARVQSDVKAAVEAGLTTRNDLMRVELEQNRLASNRLKLDNAVRTLKNAFGLHIGVASDSFDISQPDFSRIALPVTKADDSLALHRRPEYQLLQKGVEAAQLQLKMEVGKNLPTVAVGAGYTSLKTDLGEKVEMSRNFGIALATVSVPISGWWGGSHAIKKRRLELRAAENTRSENADLLQLQMQRLADELSEAYEQVLIAQKSISVAQENALLSENGYHAGVSILSDLLDAQNLLQQSRDQHTEAATRYYLKLAEWRKVMGTNSTSSAL
jgi:outer membrane protein TolC